MFMLITVNLVFALGLVGLLVGNVVNNYVWLAFLALWCVAEGALARDPSIRWWQWLLVLVGLGCLDIILFLFFSH